MEEHFEIITGEYVFDGIIEIETSDNIAYIYIGNTKMRHHSCIFIEVDVDEKYAILHNLEYSSKCELNDKLESGIGTIIMAKTSLRYIIDTFTYINYVVLFDKAKKNGINITPKKLLLGKLGWYQYHFGAKPNLRDEKTKSIIRSISKIELTESERKIIENKNWGKDEEISNKCKELKIPLIIGTSWKIDKADIMKYDVSYKIRKIQKGGTKIKDTFRKILNKAEYSNVSWQNL
jgi:hypothetical protein